MQRRVRRTLTVSFLITGLLAFVLLVGVSTTASASTVSYAPEEQAFLKLINDYRAGLGLGALKVSDALSESGDRHACDMAKYSFFSHYTVRSDWFANGATPWDRMAASGYDHNTYKGENIAAGQPTAAEAFEAWKNSPSHNDNMVDPNYKVIGISLIYVGTSTYRYYWTTDFGGYVDPSAHSLGVGDGTAPLASGAMFTDVTGSTRYATEIMLLAKQGAVAGYSDGSFGPYDEVSRQQFAKMAVLSLGYSASPVSACSFADVSARSSSSDPLYPAGYIATCAARGITMGATPYTFRPYDNITRAQLITMVARAAGLPDPPETYTPSFSNFSADHYPWARRAAYAGWLDDFVDMGPGFDFWAPATRGEVCLLLSEVL
jgi:uncharacterized protein YkwD